MWLLRATATIGGLTLLSRVVGLVREMLMANFLGAGLASDVFKLAFRLPNLLRRIFAEGAFNAAFVPMFSGMLATEGKDPALDFAAKVQSLLASVLIGVCLLFMAAMPWVMYVYAFGYRTDPEKLALTVELSRIMFGYLFFIALTSMLSGLLNSAERYASAAFAPTLLNILMIVGMLLGQHFETPVHALAWSVLAAGVAQWLWLVASARRCGMLPRWVKPGFDPKVVKMLKNMAPVALGASVGQLNLLIDGVLATSLATGAVSYLDYADRLNQLPLGVVGVGIGTALLPMISKMFREDRMDEARTALNRAIEFTLLLSLPAAAAFLSMGGAIVKVVYQRGEFTAENAHFTALALQAFACGLPALVLVKIFLPGFYATHDTKTPLRIAIGCLVLNTLLSIALMPFIAQTGMAVATSVSGWANIGAMAYLLHKRGFFRPDKELFFRLPRLLLASGIMAVVLVGLGHLCEGIIMEGGAKAMVALGGMIGIGTLCYVAACFALKLTTPAELRGLLKRKSKTAEPDPSGMES